MKRAALLPVLALLLMAATEPPLPPEEETEHVVKAGETLGGIAQRAQVPRVLIAEANGLKPPYLVREGQKLVIPRTGNHTVSRGETGFTIAYTYGVRWADIAVANGIDPDKPIRPGQKLLIPTVVRPPQAQPAGEAAPPPAVATVAAPKMAWPLAGPVRRGFVPRGRRNHHDGLDIRAPSGTAVRAVAEGRVMFAGVEPRQFGNLVIVDHGDGLHSAYAFLSRMTVKVGDHVNQGERVGLVGNTGQARGYELHFELRRDNRPIDPTERLPERK